MSTLNIFVSFEYNKENELKNQFYRQAEGYCRKESACLQCASTPMAGSPETMKTDKKHDSRRESHPLLDRPEIEWPCRT